MPKRTIILLFLLLLVIIYWAFIEQGYKESASLIGKPAPDFSLKDEKGNRVALADYRGKVVLLHFWATWCAPCIEEFPLLNKFYKKFPEDQFALIAISMDEEGLPVIDKFRQQVPFDFTITLTKSPKVADEYGTYRLPESYLIDKEGKVVRKIIGPQNWNSPGWASEVRKLLNAN